MDVLLGSMMLFAGNFAPSGFVECTGQTLPIEQNAALFSVLGTTYGGDGVKTFGLPAMQHGVTPGMRWCMAIVGIFPQRP